MRQQECPTAWMKPRSRSPRKPLALFLFIAAGLVPNVGIPFSSAAHAQVVQEPKAQTLTTPDLSPALTRLLDQPYLTPEQGRDLRIHHGVWRETDLELPADRARAALVSGRFWDPSLSDPGASPIDRAEAALLRGASAQTLTLLEGQTSLRALRLRAEALLSLGRVAEANTSLDAITAAMSASELTNADELVEGVRGLLISARLRGPWRDARQDYRTITQLLGRARDELDRLSWKARLVEAELLMTKDNQREARQALIESLKLNPSCARAWQLLGQLAVDQFDFQTAETIATKLDELASKVDPSERIDAAPADIALTSRSPWAAELRARAMLRQRDAENAIATLDPMLDRFPTKPSLLALRAAAEAGTFDMQAVESRLVAFDDLSRDPQSGNAPTSALALYEVGRALADARQYELSDAFLARAVDREPNWSEPLIERGLMLSQAGRDVESLDVLKRARELDPFNIAVENTVKLLTELLTYETLQSEHFTVRFKAGRDAVLAAEMIPLLEAMHARVCGTEDNGLDFKPPIRTTIDLMPNHEWFSVRITGMPGIHTMAAATGPIIAMESPADGPGHLVGPYDWLRVVRHEYVHTVTLARTNNRIPHWFTEAAAVFLEDAPRDARTIQLLTSAFNTDTLFDLDAINIAFVRPKKPTDRSQAYAQGHWMYQYIVERFGARAPLELMDQYALGTTEESAYQRVLGQSRAAFFQDFKVWAEQQLISWGMRMSPDTPDARTLIEQAMAPGVRKGDGGIELLEPLSPEDALVRALADHPQHPQLLALAVEAALEARRGVPDESMIDLLERAAAARPMDDRPQRALARVYLTMNTPESRDRAIPHLEWLDTREVHSPAFASELAHLYAERQEWDLARAKAQRVARLAPFDADTRELAARVAIATKDWDEARHQLNALISIEPDREIHRKRMEALDAMATAK
ncbi:peptidase MA family metallohydrolase [Nodularia spumigena]|uniref:peptidase MA family metallohydrolase n=1 Tax=Nodularia spumigena TaxID=70799 RepID=UPI002B20ED57|nr:hypothetical protein [Nodularia spumigena]MEA5557642.1 hypothetical protein [Nodularia spumigena CH309]